LLTYALAALQEKYKISFIAKVLLTYKMLYNISIKFYQQNQKRLKSNKNIVFDF